MAMICSVKEARDALKSDPDNMICMDRDFGCWIRKGILDSAGVMIADGEKVAEISIEHAKRQHLSLEPAADLVRKSA